MEHCPTNLLYKALLSYKYYRLDNSSLDPAPRETVKIHDCIKRLELLLRNQNFSGEDPILMLEFQARFVTEANILGMGVGQA